MIKVKIGNILGSKARTLVNTVNCVGIMGKGIALDFKMKFSDMYQQYLSKCKRNEVKPGEPYIYTDLDGPRIINFPTKKHWKNYSNVDDIIKGLNLFIKKYKEWGIESVAFPPLGCGNGGLDWEYVGPIMYNKLKDLDIDIEIYAPFGTKQEQLTMEFLSRDVDINSIKKRYRQKVKPEWIVLLKALENLNRRPYANPIGRVMFQKICFVGDQLDLVDFNFKKGSYGPFSTETNKAKATLSNNNILREEKRGRMFVVTLGDEYDTFKKKYKNEILINQDKIDMITDLFQRINNTDQAEEVSTVLWVERELQSKNKDITISDTDIINEIVEWKPKWNNDDKLRNIYNAILNLNMLNWTNIIIKNREVKKYLKCSM